MIRSLTTHLNTRILNSIRLYIYNGQKLLNFENLEDQICN